MSENEALECEAKGSELPLAKVGDTIELKIIECRNDGSTDTYLIDTVLYQVECRGHFITYELGDEREDDESKETYYYPYEGIWGNEAFKEFCKVIGGEIK